ncbi:hypothetical protein [Gynuella sp.]|uniref:hypothetical protein n=1 Tax=Gynuella sp. TaxID=2969146 RepID=UPI003D104D02
MSDYRKDDNKNFGQYADELCTADRLKACFRVSTVMGNRYGCRLKMLRSDRPGIPKIWQVVVLPKLTSSRRYRQYLLPYEWLLTGESPAAVSHSKLLSDNRRYLNMSRVIKQFFNTGVQASLHTNTVFEQVSHLHQNRDLRLYQTSTYWSHHKNELMRESLSSVRPSSDHDIGWKRDPERTTRAPGLSPRRVFSILNGVTDEGNAKNIFSGHSDMTAQGGESLITQLISASAAAERRPSTPPLTAAAIDDSPSQQHIPSAPFDNMRIQQNIAALVATDKQNHADYQAQLQALQQQMHSATQQQSQTVRQLEQTVNSMATMLQQAMQSQPPRPLPPSYYGALK